MNINEQEKELIGGIKLMVWIIIAGLALNLFLICGCSTTKQNTTSKIAPVVIPQLPPMIHLTWDENYIQTNEMTVIIESQILTVPKSLWVIAFEGSTNQCWIPMIYNQAFFKAYNTNI